jgi:hypothetical protein
MLLSEEGVPRVPHDAGAGVTTGVLVIAEATGRNSKALVKALKSGEGNL